MPANLNFDPDPPTHHRWVMARRSLSDPSELAYHLAYAPVDAEIAELVRIAGDGIRRAEPRPGAGRAAALVVPPRLTTAYRDGQARPGDISCLPPTKSMPGERRLGRRW